VRRGTLQRLTSSRRCNYLAHGHRYVGSSSAQLAPKRRSAMRLQRARHRAWAGAFPRQGRAAGVWRVVEGDGGL